MKISKNVVDALVEQYNFELESGYIYLAMVHDLKDKAWDGFAHFMDKQAHEGMNMLLNSKLSSKK